MLWSSAVGADEMRQCPQRHPGQHASTPDTPGVDKQQDLGGGPAARRCWVDAGVQAGVSSQSSECVAFEKISSPTGGLPLCNGQRILPKHLLDIIERCNKVQLGSISELCYVRHAAAERHLSKLNDRSGSSSRDPSIWRQILLPAGHDSSGQFLACLRNISRITRSAGRATAAEAGARDDHAPQTRMPRGLAAIRMSAACICRWLWNP